MTKKHPTLGAFFALTGALLFGLNASSSKVVMASGITGGEIVLLRSLATATLAGLALVLTNRRGFRVSLRQWPSLILFGVIGVGVMQWAYSMAVSNLQIGLALLIEYTAIVWVPIVSWLLFKKKVGVRVWLGVALVLGGLLVVSKLTLSGLNMTGVGFAFLAAATLTLYFIMGERIQTGRDAMSTLFYSMLISSIFWFTLTPHAVHVFDKIKPTIELGGNLAGTVLPTWMLLAWIGVMGSFIPMLLSYLALRHLSATGVGIASTAETVFAFAFGLLWLGEEISSFQWLGGALVIAGIVISQTNKRR